MAEPANNGITTGKPPRSMDSFSAYLPIDRRIALTAGERLPDRAGGAVLFADISGFTNLTSAMANEYGPQRGAEEIAGWLNRVYGAIIERVHEYRGSVVSFNGDAITCWFDDRPAGAAGADRDGSARAVACAFAMQETIAQFRSIRLPSGATTTLHIKVAIVAGPVRRFDVGRPEMQRIDVLAGTLLDRVTMAQELWNQDEVIAGQEIVDQLGEQLEIQAWRAYGDGQRFAVIQEQGQRLPTSPWYEVPPIADAVAAEWLWAPVLERLTMAQGAFLAELRASAVVLYLSFSGLDYDEEDAGEQLDHFVSWVQATLSRFGGFLLQLTIGDKGSYLLATFGTIRAHEDDPARALEAALALQALPADLQYIKDMGIGISRGTLYTGAFGGPRRQTYSVLGREANVGARLMAVARPGQTVVSAPVVDAVGTQYAFDELGWLPLKGVTQPRRLFLLIGKQEQEPDLGSAPPSATPMVGRARERAMLSAKLTALQNGQSNTVVIEGDPGIGKSRLAGAFLAEAQEIGMPILVGAGDAIEQGTPYYAWRPIFRTLFDLAPNVDPATCQEHIWTELPDDPEIRQLAPLLNAVLPTNFPDNALTEKMAGEARATSTRNLLVTLLAGSFAQSPGLVVVLEDGHWLDSASWALAAQARHSLAPLLLVIVTRPMAEEALQTKEAHMLLSVADAERIRLSTMSPEEISILVWRRLGVNSLPQPIIELILNQGEGHPFYSEEIAYALRDTGYLLIEDGQARLADQTAALHDIDFPATIQGVITSRIDQLEASEQLTLKVASVIGRVFALYVLTNIYPEASVTPSLPAHLQKFDHLDITSLEAPEPELAYLFKHIITQEVVYNLMTFSQRAWLHRRAAEWYETQYAEELAPFYPLLAYHWRRAEDKTKAIDFLEKAGRQALRDNANKEAVAFFSEIRELAASPEVQVDVLTQATWARQMADAHVGLGDIVTGQAYYAEAAALLGQPVPASRPRLVASLIGQLVAQSAHRLWPARFLNRSPESGSLLEAARAYHGLGFINYVSNETLPFAHATLKALNLAEPAGLSRPLAEGYATLCVIASLLPGDRLPELYARMAMSAAEELQDPSISGNVSIRIAVYHSGMGHWPRAEEAAQQAIAHYESINDLRGWGDSVNVHLYVLFFTGRFEQCLDRAQDLYQTAQRNENVQHQAWGLWMSGKSLIRLGRYGEAAKYLEQAQAANELEKMHIVGALALAYWYQGLAQEALEAIGQVDIAAGEASPGFATLSANTTVAETYLLAWEAALLPTLQAGARQACKSLRNFSRFFPIGQPAAWLYQGNLEWLEGNADKAFQAWHKAIEFGQQLAMPYELARAHFEIGRHLPPADSDRQQHLRLAAEVFEQLGSAGDLQRVRHNMAPAADRRRPGSL